MNQRRSEKVIKADFLRSAAIAETEKSSSDAVKAFKHKAYYTERKKR